MNDFFLYVLMGAPPAGAEGAAAGGAGSLISLFPFVIIIAIFYFLIIRPQNKKQKETQRMLGALKKGDKVVTIGGIYGTIASMDGTDVVVKVDDNTRIKFLRSAISNVLNAEEKKEEKAGKPEKPKKIEAKKDDKTDPPVEENAAEADGDHVEAKDA